MADKKITALTELTAAAKNHSDDLLHIIDYSASPVNKKITLASLFSTIDTPITSYGAHTHDIGASSAASGLSVVVANATPASGAETEIVVNDDGNAYVDFRIQTSLNDNAILVDSSLDSGAGNCNTVTINGGAIASTKKVDFNINSSTGVLFHTDSTDHVVGVGTTTPSANYLLDVAADATTGHSINSAGNLLLSGTETVVGSADGTGAGVISLLTPISLISVTGTKAYSLAAGTQGQIKTLICSVAASTPNGTVTPTALNGGTSLDVDALGEVFVLMFANSTWNILSMYGGSVNA